MTIGSQGCWRIWAFLATSSLSALWAPGNIFGQDSVQMLKQTYRDGNYQEAFAAMQKWLVSTDASGDPLVEIFEMAEDSLRRLGRIDELDEFRERVLASHPQSWQLLAAVARSYLTHEHYGVLIGGDFHRGRDRSRGRVVNAFARDRARALQLYRKASQLVADTDDQEQVAGLWQGFSEALLFFGGGSAWRLQELTDLDELPDFEDGWIGWGGDPTGAPVDENGDPVFYDAPADWKAAENDGQRWRWVLEQLAEVGPAQQELAWELRARFLHQQFGVQTIAQFRPLARAVADGEAETGTWALHTLTDDETIARLATGVKRFRLPDEHNFIKLYERVLESHRERTDGKAHESAIVTLANIYENRRQYPRAAEYWRMAVSATSGNVKQSHQQRLEQIVGNWGQFEPVMTQPAGRGATVDFRFRNGSRVEFVAQQINVRQLLNDVKAYLKSNPQQLDWRQLEIDNIGYRLVQEGQEKYLTEESARWTLELQPREKHFDRRITVTTPLQKAGAYLVTAKMADGNTSKIVLWVADTAIVRKPMPDKAWYFVGDAISGKPLPKVNVELFGYWQQHIDPNIFRVHTSQLAELTDENGQVFLPIRNEEPHRNMNWVAIATTSEGRLAYLGFNGVWLSPYQREQYNATKVFTITDRPVYRPGQKVQFKFWVGQAQYDQDDKSPFAHQSFQVEIRDPRNEKAYSQTLAADEYGGIEGEFELPAAATLGQYRLLLVNLGGGSFRVEEYKKPEFEVLVEAPEEPIALGEKVTATIKANYYFGSPVVNATVKYKVLRTTHDSVWFPPDPWDWLYGPGYWWFSYDYPWYPGWVRWGSGRPAPWWFWRAPMPPEVVAEREAPIGPDGTIEVEIDTSLAKELHPDHDHSYQIQAEVVDESRRTIVGNGRVLVARKPFKVFAWVNQGHYRVGDTVTAHFAARRLDGKPVQGQGTLKLLQVTYQGEELEPTETEVRSWDLATNSQGQAQLEFNASQAGQYRLSYTVTDSAGHAIEGGYVLTIRGEGFDGREFRFSDLELIPDRANYQPEEKVRLQINTNRVGSTVLLFVRPIGGTYLPPQFVRLEGKSTTVELDVTKGDMPNFFVEAITLSDGRVHTQARQIAVPPESRVLNVEVVPSRKEYAPGQAAEVKLKLTDHNGKPFVGSTVLAVYDKSVEYISGGSNVPDIKEFFWKWQRHHRPHSESNLGRWSINLIPPGQTGMQNIGIFGGTVADELDNIERAGEITTAVPSRHRMSEVQLGAASDAAVPQAPVAAPATLGREPMAGKLGDAEPLVEPTVRQEFADTALWIAALETDPSGLATANLEMPENLTSWKVRVWGMGHGTRVGEGTAEVVTRKNLIVRMQAPRFFLERDEVVLSANVHNYLPAAKQVQVRLELEGDVLQAESVTEETIEIDAGGEKRIDWRVKVLREGEATIRMLALTDEESDAVQMGFPAHVHGMLKTEAYSGVIRRDESAGSFEVTVPAERRPEQTRLEVRYSPTLAGAMVDALPYLIDYPYGCTEQTLNRFLPAVITQQTLIRLGFDLKAIQEKRTNLNAQEIGDDRERAQGWKRFDRNPVFSEAELSRVVKEGVQRLTEMQLADGGWGWFSGWGERSTAHTTALVVRGLQIAQQNDVAVLPDVLQRGIAWLEQYQSEQLKQLANVGDDGNVIDESKPAKRNPDNLDALVYMVLVDAGSSNEEMREYLYSDRTELAVYGLAMLGVALEKQDRAEELAMVLRNLRQYVVEDDENQTAYLRMPQTGWWYWYGSEFEAHAFYLKLLAATEPQSELASRLVKYLLNNRKHATYWNSTRDTALVIEALAEYLAASDEASPEMTVEIRVDGQERQRVEITRDNLFAFDNSFVLTGSALESGRHTVELVRSGDGPLYYNGYLTNFTLEDDIRRAGLELKVNRRFYRLVPAEKTTAVSGGRGQAVEQRVEKYNREPVTNFGTLPSGSLVEVELVVESKNDYEYIVLEDMKAAGFEPVELRSGYHGNELGAYMELRDDRVSLFLRQLPRGTHSVSYRLRAEIPGQFSALPTKAYAMYAPELKANSDEIKVRIQD